MLPEAPRIRPGNRASSEARRRSPGRRTVSATHNRACTKSGSAIRNRARRRASPDLDLAIHSGEDARLAEPLDRPRH